MPRLHCQHLALIAILVAGAALPPGQCKAGEKNLAAMKFEQKSTVDGPYTLLVLDLGVKVSFPLRHFVYLCAAPTWKPVIFNTKTKTKVTFVGDYWSGFHIGDDTKTRYSKASSMKSSWNGKPVLRIARPAVVSDALRENVEMLYQQGNSRSETFKSEELVVAAWPKLRPQVLTFLHNFYRLPEIDNILLRRVHAYANGKNDAVLDTMAYNAIAVPASDLLYPTGYHEVQDMAVVTEEAQRRKEAAGVFEDLFEESGNKRHGR